MEQVPAGPQELAEWLTAFGDGTKKCSHNRNEYDRKFTISSCVIQEEGRTSWLRWIQVSKHKHAGDERSREIAFLRRTLRFLGQSEKRRIERASAYAIPGLHLPRSSHPDANTGDSQRKRVEDGATRFLAD